MRYWLVTYRNLIATHTGEPTIHVDIKVMLTPRSCWHHVIITDTSYQGHVDIVSMSQLQSKHTCHILVDSWRQDTHRAISGFIYCYLTARCDNSWEIACNIVKVGEQYYCIMQICFLASRDPQVVEGAVNSLACLLCLICIPWILCWEPFSVSSPSCFPQKW